MFLILQAVIVACCLYWIIICLNRLPRDLSLIIDYFREKNWRDFGVEVGVFIFIWIVSAGLFYLFVWPLVYRLIGVVKMFF